MPLHLTTGHGRRYRVTDVMVDVVLLACSWVVGEVFDSNAVGTY